FRDPLADILWSAPRRPIAEVIRLGSRNRGSARNQYANCNDLQKGFHQNSFSAVSSLRSDPHKTSHVRLGSAPGLLIASNCTAPRAVRRALHPRGSLPAEHTFLVTE